MKKQSLSSDISLELQRLKNGCSKFLLYVVVPIDSLQRRYLIIMGKKRIMKLATLIVELEPA